MFFLFRTTTNVENDEESNGIDDEQLSPDDGSVRPCKRRRSSSNGEQMKIFENIAQSFKENNSMRNDLIQKIFSDKKEPQSEMELFFLSMCRTVEKFSPLEQATLKMQISQIVSQVELSHLGQGGNLHPMNAMYPNNYVPTARHDNQMIPPYTNSYIPPPRQDNQMNASYQQPIHNENGTSYAQL